jgi:membrane protein YqaA with SNARE-associated domain
MLPMKQWFKNLHEWSLKWANTKWGAWGLFICAFADASFLPLPTPMFFIALALLNIKKAYVYALYGTFGSLFGAMAGYAIGHFAWLSVNGDFTPFANFVFNHVPGFTVDFYNKILLLFEKWDLWILLVASLIPIPYKIFSISSGVFDVNFLIFCIATFVSQGVKFYIFAFLSVKLGQNIKKILEFNYKPIAIIATASVVVAVFAFKLF